MEVCLIQLQSDNTSERASACYLLGVLSPLINRNYSNRNSTSSPLVHSSSPLRHSSSPLLPSSSPLRQVNYISNSSDIEHNK